MSESQIMEKFQTDFGYSMFLPFLLFVCGQSEVKRFVTNSKKRKKTEEEEPVMFSEMIEKAVEEHSLSMNAMQNRQHVGLGTAHDVMDRVLAAESKVALLDGECVRLGTKMENMEGNLQGFCHELTSLTSSVNKLHAALRVFGQDWNQMRAPGTEIPKITAMDEKHGLVAEAVGPVGVHEKSQLVGADGEVAEKKGKENYFELAGVIEFDDDGLDEQDD